MPNPVHLFNKPSWPSGLLGRLMDSILEGVQQHLLRHNTDQFVLCSKKTPCHNGHFLTGSLHIILVLNEIMKAHEAAKYGKYGTV